MSDRIIARIAKLAVNAKTRGLVTRIVEAAMAERTRDIMITLIDDGQHEAAEMIGSNYTC